MNIKIFRINLYDEEPFVTYENAKIRVKENVFIVEDILTEEEYEYDFSYYRYEIEEKNVRSGTQEKIVDLTNAIQDLLLYKNSKYGDSAINPNNVFYKGDSTNSILIRLDDKIGRVKSNTESKPRVNDVCDIIGYCTLLLISMGVTQNDIAAFKD